MKVEEDLTDMLWLSGRSLVLIAALVLGLPCNPEAFATARVARARSNALWSSDDNDYATSSSRMKAKLREESRFPYKLPLLGASAVIGGKGLTDGMLTVVKVVAGIRGSTISEEFLGMPVLAIDAACAAGGIALGAWTWKTMQ